MGTRLLSTSTEHVFDISWLPSVGGGSWRKVIFCESDNPRSSVTMMLTVCSPAANRYMSISKLRSPRRKQWRGTYIKDACS